MIVAAGGTPSAVAAKAATATIPIVFGVAVDPVEVGLVASLSRPGGNVTGVTNLNVEVGPKRLELLRELLPSVTVMAVLVNPASPAIADPFVQGMQAASRTLGLQLHVLHASTERDFDTVFATLVQLRAGALVIGPDIFFNARSEQLAALTVRHAVPAIFQYRAVRRGRRPARLRDRRIGVLPSGRRLRWPHSQGREAGRPAGAAGRPKSSWSSTSRPPRRSASPCRRRCSPAPTR